MMWKTVLIILAVICFVVITIIYIDIPVQKHNTSKSYSAINHQHEENIISRDNFTYGLNFHLSYNIR